MVQLSQVYGYVRFNGKDLRASQNNLVSFMSQRKLNFDAKIKQVSQDIDVALHRSGNGIVGTLTAVSTANKTLTLSSATSLQQWAGKARLVSCSTNPTDGTAPTSGGGSAVVQKVQQTYAAGVFSVVLTMDNVANFDATTNKYIALTGNTLGFSAINPEGNIIGHGNWVPVASPSSNDNFLSSINRSNDEIRLSGFRMQAEGRKFSEAIAECNAVTTSMGGSTDIILANPMDFQKASIELGANAVYSSFKVGETGFSALETGGPAGGKLRWVEDPNQDAGVLRGMTLETWKLLSMGAIPHVMDEDGLTLRKDAGADAWQVGLRAWPQQICLEPYCNWVLTGF
jgi:hypothetical protein